MHQKDRHILLIVPSRTSLSILVYYRDPNKKLHMETWNIGDTLDDIALKLWAPTAEVYMSIYTEILEYFFRTEKGQKLYDSIVKSIGSSNITLKACYPEKVPEHGNALINVIFETPNGFWEDALQPDEQPTEARKLFEPAYVMLNHFQSHVKECIESQIQQTQSP